MSVRLPFRTRPQSTVVLYRPSLQWPMYGVDASRTQSQTGIHLRPPFREIWERDAGSLIEFPAVVSDGAAYVGNFHGTVTAIAMDDGHVLWKHLQPGGKMASSPAVWGDRLVVHGMDGVVRVLARSNGHLLTRYAVGSPVESSPVVRDGIDYFGTWSGRVYALDLRSMRVRWTFTPGCKLTSSVAIAGGTVYIGDYCGRLLAISRTTGHERWAGTVNGRIYGTPAVAAGRVFVPSSTGGSLSAFSTGGRFLWRRDTGSYVYSSPAVWRGRVFFGAYNGVFYALSAASGRTLWSDRHGRADLGRGRRRRRRRLRGLLRASHPRRRRCDRARSCSTSRTANTCRCPVTAAGCYCTATRVCTLSPLDEEVDSWRRGRGDRGRARPGRRLLPAREARCARHPRLLDRRVRSDASATAEGDRAGCRVADVRPRCPASSRRHRNLAPASLPAGVDIPCPQPRRVSACRRLRAPLLRQQRRCALRDQREDGQASMALRLEAVPGDVARPRCAHRLRDVSQPPALQRLRSTSG